MKERPIIFNGEMVRAILDGKKTQTRRIMKPQPEFYSDENKWRWPCKSAEMMVEVNKELMSFIGPFEKGARLWVRETWGIGTRPCPFNGWEDGIEYKADEAYLEDGDDLCLYEPNRELPEGYFLDDFNKGHWRPSIHMPRWASRITLSITDVRVERVQDISEEDAIAEDAEPYNACRCESCCQGEHSACLTGEENWQSQYRDGFKLIWDSIYGPGAWDRNDWVWVVEFERVK